MRNDCQRKRRCLGDPLLLLSREVRGEVRLQWVASQIQILDKNTGCSCFQPADEGIDEGSGQNGGLGGSAVDRREKIEMA